MKRTFYIIFITLVVSSFVYAWIYYYSNAVPQQEDFFEEFPLGTDAYYSTPETEDSQDNSGSMLQFLDDQKLEAPISE